MLYTVTINFKKGPAFGITVSAASEAEAKVIALRCAYENGFDSMPKSFKAFVQ